MSETIDTIIRWHSETFPDCTLESQLAKYSEELEEWEKTDNRQDELFELADMVIVACGIMRFDYAIGFDFLVSINSCIQRNKICDGNKVWNIVNKKMEKNRKRVWAKQENGSYHHTNKED